MRAMLTLGLVWTLTLLVQAAGSAALLRYEVVEPLDRAAHLLATLSG
jgi:hypothetical protein